MPTTKKTPNKDARAAGALLALFALWTALVGTVDVAPAGPNGSEVGLATMNVAFHELTGVNLVLYSVTDWLSLVPISIMLGFGLLGLSQLVLRRSLLEVDRNLLALGGLYVVLLAAYLAFDVVALNHRPVLIEGVLEPSYPSSTTLLVATVASTAIMQANLRIKKEGARTFISAALIAFAAFMIIARTLSSVHWLSDIVGGLLLSGGLAMAYRAVAFGGKAR